MNSGQAQVWRFGWFWDYLDAHSFLYDAVVPNRSRFGGWSNATYDDLLSQAVSTQDPETRKSLYKQAEEILVETDAVMLPLWYYAAEVASKPYLWRTYPAAGGPDVATWRIYHRRTYLPIIPRAFSSALATATPTPTPTVTPMQGPTFTPAPTPAAGPTRTPVSCDAVPVLESPGDGWSLDTLLPTFRWDWGSSRLVSHFYFEYDTDPTLARASSVQLPRGWQPPVYQRRDNLDAGTIYYWRGRFLCGESEGAWSDVWSFTTGSDGVILPGSNLVAPPNGTTLSAMPVTLEWSAVEGAVEYEVSVSRTSDWSGWSWMVTDTELILREDSWSGFEHGMTYVWWVRARNEYAWGTYSHEWRFTMPDEAP